MFIICTLFQQCAFNRPTFNVALKAITISYHFIVCYKRFSDEWGHFVSNSWKLIYIPINRTGVMSVNRTGIICCVDDWLSPFLTALAHFNCVPPTAPCHAACTTRTSRPRSPTWRLPWAGWALWVPRCPPTRPQTTRPPSTQRKCGRPFYPRP